jgi:predicted dehydrogenase
MIVYDDVAPLEKLKIFDARVERPPHYDTFAEFHYAYHYGDMYAPYIKQEEPLKTECQHFLDCIRDGKKPISSGEQGLALVRVLEASSESLKRGGAPVELARHQNAAPRRQHPESVVVPAVATNGKRKASGSKLIQNFA